MAKRRAHGEGTIFQRKDGRWTARVYVTDEAGNRKSVSRYRRTRREAVEALREMQRAREDGQQLAKGDITLDAYLNQWLEGSARPSVRPKTFQGYKSICEKRLIPRLGRVKLRALSPAQVQKLYADLERDGLSPRSVINTHRVLRRTLNQAMKWGLVVRNVCDIVDKPRVPRSEMRTLTAEQAKQLMDATVGDRLHALYVLALTTGMRLGELLGLKWEDLDLENRRLHIRRALQHVAGEGHVFTEPKTSRSRRTVMLSARAVAALREHRRLQLEERLAFAGDWSMPELVFPNTLGNPQNPGNVSNAFKKALAAENLPAIRFHDTRHTAATLLFSQDHHPKVVADMLGHSTIALTLDTYSHVLPSMHEEAARTMDILFGTGTDGIQPE